MNYIKKILITIFSSILVLSSFSIDTKAALVNTADNTTFKQTSIPTGIT